MITSSRQHQTAQEQISAVPHEAAPVTFHTRSDMRVVVASILRRAAAGIAHARWLQPSPGWGCLQQTQSMLHTSPCVSTARDGHFIGAYTPVTKKLWEERLSWADKQQQQRGAPPAAAAAAVSSRPPEVTEVQYPFTTDRVLVELYKNPWGYVRIGRVLEDLDSLAGSIAFAHCRCPSTGAYPVLVTAAVDAIHLRHPLQIGRDAVMRGQVVWTGRTALDIRMELLQKPHDPDPSLVAIFSFVALDWANKRPTPVPQLQPLTPQEQQWAQERQQLAQQRKAARQATQEQQQQQTLTPQQQQKLDALEASARLHQDMPALADPHQVLMAATSLANAFTCQPQQRNMQGRIFGGFLMRRAFELAFATTHLFAGARPTFLLVDEITFRKPVDVADLLRFKSHVLEAEATGPGPNPGDKVWRVVVDVEAMVSQPEARTSVATNTFRFVFKVTLPEGQRLKQVLPGSVADVARLQEYWSS